ncbi:DNA-3-methyladenine glycosylase 2 family protein [Arthrobacter sp. CAU 1506]|uniref:DNA-3-methyladenine glycosylase family protein n=1 Tax=Arthrobacter sp. CAU 1506 TaxID=2560052 RepID=UPI0010ACC74B|nr:AlkA N-terminal domain-containing protein [Arthrobacter sp. CAU 1506]TJY69277.1 DNA-3-methyladenine glycosylase 2 family protein [Arthrobacter sp. CAU 1506]
MQVDLPLAPPFDAPAALAALAAHAVPGLERVDPAAGTCTRLFLTGTGPVPVTATLLPDSVSLDIGAESPAAVADITTAVRGWLDLELEPERVAAMLGNDAVVGPLIAARPGLRILGYPDGFEGAVCTVVGQQVSLAAARTFTGRLVSAFGSPACSPGRSPSSHFLPHEREQAAERERTAHPEPKARTAVGRSRPPNEAVADLVVFPTPETLAAAGPEAIRQAVGLTNARARTVHALAEACAAGLRIAPDTDHAEVRRRLLALPGIGPWTVEYLAMRALHDRDAYPEGDLVLQRALEVKTAKQARELGQAWAPVRAYAVFHLWTASAYLP